MSINPTPKASAPQVIIRYLNQSGALVQISEQQTSDAFGYKRPQYTATCAGCLDGHGDHYPERALNTARKWAAGHSAACRALPQPETTDQPGGTK